MQKFLAAVLTIVFVFGFAPLVGIEVPENVSAATSVFYGVDITGLTTGNGASGSLTDAKRGRVEVNLGQEGAFVDLSGVVAAPGVYKLTAELSAPQSGTLSMEMSGRKDTSIFTTTSTQVSMDFLLPEGQVTGRISLVQGEGLRISAITLVAEASIYQAEAGKRSGYALITENQRASGGAVVSKIGGPDTDLGSVVILAYTPFDGLHGVIFDYIRTGGKPFKVSANGEESIEINHNDAGLFSKEGTKYAKLNLKKGVNRIRIYSDTEDTLSLDYITVFAPRKSNEGMVESSAARLSGGAYVRRCYGADDSYVIAGLGEGATADFTVKGARGVYTLGIWYSSPDYRALEVSVDGVVRETVFCPITAEDFNIETVTIELTLNAGTHRISFGNRFSKAPDIDKIQLTMKNVISSQERSSGTEVFENDFVSVKYDMATGLADFYNGDVQRVKGIQSVVKVEDSEYINTVVKSSDYAYRTLDVSEVEDGYGKGKIYSVVSEKQGLPNMIQSFYVYDEQPYILVKVELSVDEEQVVSSNFMSPISTVGDNVVNIGDKKDARALFMPYDNDAWIKYNAEPLPGAHTSYWATAIYDDVSRNAVVTGSVDHDTWKTAVSSFSSTRGGATQPIGFLGSFGGIWSARYTYDFLPHGSIDGQTISSPKMFLGYFDDWRDGLVAYGEANANNVPRLNWDGGVPFGYNSWYGQGTKLNYRESIEVSDFLHELSDFKDDQDVVYVNLDSYWDNFTQQELKDFVKKCNANGQKAGIYWSHFVFWATNMTWPLGVPGHEYSFRDAALEDEDGGVVAMAKDTGTLPLDPTSPAMMARLKYLMEMFTEYGYEFLKIDFLNYAAIEGVYHDPSIKTGMQAYNFALKEFTKYVDTDKFLLSYSIAPTFPYQYAHARRISCDTAANIGEIEYMLNSYTYGFWQDDTLYEFTDPDHISFEASPIEARTRYNSAVISGTLMLLSDDYKHSAMKTLTRQLTSNKEVNDLARRGKGFKPVKGNTGEWASDLYTLEDNGEFYLAVFNFSRYNSDLRVDMERIGLSPDKTYSFYDMWDKSERQFTGRYTDNISPANSTIFRITEVTQAPSVNN